MNLKFQNFLNIFRKLTIDILFVEALKQMLTHARFIKQILSKKKKREEFETVALNEEYGAPKEITLKVRCSMEIRHSLLYWLKFFIQSPL